MKETIAMLLAGGQGSRLYALTQNIAKPAVPYGGKYRIIDFPLSNCINSGIDTVGVLTQYQPLVLNEYIGDGRPWDLDRLYGGVHVLPPYQKASGSDWYLGTANAIYQNISFIDRYDPKNVVILSGDHIYKMNYNKMVTAHLDAEASCTIAVMEVPKEEASRFGIMNTRKDGTIFEFEEKPKNPKSNLASMGIYVFDWPKLRKYLIEDAENPNSNSDFGKDIIPTMLAAGEKMLSYRFEGYWKDVGTIDSLWEANMDLIDPNVPFDLWDDSWRIYSRNSTNPPQFISDYSKVENSMICEGSVVDGFVDFSVISYGCVIKKGAEVRDSILMPGTVVEEGATVQYSIIGENAVIKAGAVVGERPEDIKDLDSWGVAVVAPGVTVGNGSKVKAKAMIYSDVEGGVEKC